MHQPLSIVLLSVHLFKMCLSSLLKLLYIFCVTFLPVILDTGLQVLSNVLTFILKTITMGLQVWNGVEINSTDFRPTLEWRGRCPRENFPVDTFAHENWGHGYKVMAICSLPKMNTKTVSSKIPNVKSLFPAPVLN